MSLARSYARALYESSQELAQNAKGANFGPSELASLQAELAHFVSLSKASREARMVLESAVVSADERVAFVLTLSQRAGYSKLASNFLLLIAKKGRFGSLAEISDAFAAVCLEAQGGLFGNVVSADPVDAADLQGLADAFTKKLGKKVAFKSSVDSELLAGMKVTVSGITYDGTLKAKIQRLRDRLASSTGMVH